MRLELRVSVAFLRRLDALAERRGMNRSEAVRAAVLEATETDAASAPPAPDADELARLLGEAARGGSVSAMRALLLEHRRNGAAPPPADELGPIDQLAARRTATAQRHTPPNHDASQRTQP